MRRAGRLFTLVGMALASAVHAFGQEPVLPDLSTSEPQVQKKLTAAHARVVSDPRNAAAWGHYAMNLEAHRHTEHAEAAYRRAAELDSQEVRWPYLLAAMLEYTDPEEALRFHEIALRLDDDYAPGQYRTATTLEKLGRLDAAARRYERAVALDSGFGLAHFGLGRLALGRGDVEAAVRHLEQAYRLAPDTQAVVATLARAYNQAGNRDLARQRAAEARTLPRMTHHPDARRAAMMAEAVSTESYLRRSRTYMEVGQLDRSLRELEALLDFQPENHDAHFAAAGVLDRMGRPEAAVRAARRALDLEPGLPGARAVLAGALFKQGDFAAARRESDNVLKSDPENFHMLLVRSMLAAQSGDTVTMVRSLDRAYEARESDPELRALLRGLLQDLAESFGAIGEFGEAAQRVRWLREMAVEEGAPSAAVAQLDRRLEALERRAP